MTSHEEVSWPLTLRQEIPNIHISKGVFYLIIGYFTNKKLQCIELGSPVLGDHNTGVFL